MKYILLLSLLCYSADACQNDKTLLAIQPSSTGAYYGSDLVRSMVRSNHYGKVWALYTKPVDNLGVSQRKLVYRELWPSLKVIKPDDVVGVGHIFTDALGDLLDGTMGQGPDFDLRSRGLKVFQLIEKLEYRFDAIYVLQDRTIMSTESSTSLKKQLVAAGFNDKKIFVVDVDTVQSLDRKLRELNSKPLSIVISMLETLPDNELLTVLNKDSIVKHIGLNNKKHLDIGFDEFNENLSVVINIDQASFNRGLIEGGLVRHKTKLNIKRLDELKLRYLYINAFDHIEGITHE